jgi:hypothetical protein
LNGGFDPAQLPLQAFGKHVETLDDDHQAPKLSRAGRRARGLDELEDGGADTAEALPEALGAGADRPNAA